MRVFVTGATGFIGSAVIEELLGAGHSVVGLARTEAGAKRLRATGAEAVRGSLRDLESLRRGAASADGVIHLAFMHAPSKASFGDFLRIFLGGSPGGIVRRFFAAATDADRGAIEAIGGALAGSGRLFVTTFGTLSVASSAIAAEDAVPDPQSIAFGRASTELAVRAWAEKGVRAMVIRLPPSVHGDGDKGFVPMLAGFARKNKVSPYIGDGANRWPAVHRLDAAKLYRLALENGAAGACYHGVADEGVPFREIAGVFGRRLNVPVVSKPAAESAAHFSFLAPFVAMDNPTSSARTQQTLGWEPKEAGLIADIDRPGYFGA